MSADVRPELMTREELVRALYKARFYRLHAEARAARLEAEFILELNRRVSEMDVDKRCALARTLGNSIYDGPMFRALFAALLAPRPATPEEGP